jgi:ubiquinone/menaquinone biosynthesis C-methylase UbiE
METDIKRIINEYQKDLLPLIGKYLQGKQLLDVGCGNGLNSFFFNKKFNTQITLLDVTDMRNKSVKDFPFVKASAEKIPFGKNSFEIVFLQYVLHHLPSEIIVLRVLKELKRVGEKIIVVEEIKTAKTILEKAKKFDEDINRKIHPRSDMPIYKYYSDLELKNLFKKANLDFIEEHILHEGNRNEGFIERKVYVLS